MKLLIDIKIAWLPRVLIKYVELIFLRLSALLLNQQRYMLFSLLLFILAGHFTN